MDGSFVDWFKQAVQGSGAPHDSTQQRKVDQDDDAGAEPAHGL